MHSDKALVNAAKSYLAQQAAVTTGSCAVLWQQPAYTREAFRERVSIARSRLPKNRLLVVVCAFGAVARSIGLCVVELPPIKLSLFSGAARYRGCYGGRGAGRSWTFARALIAKSLERRSRILCAREFQNSIADSILTLLADQIEVLGLAHFFEIQATAIYGRNGSEFIFSGIRSNPTRVKSTEGVNIAFIEEAAQITERSWEILIPTIRAIDSEIWAAWNPDLESDPTHQRFVVRPPDSAIVLKTTYADNPWFPPPLRAEMEYLKSVDPDAHSHVWLGNCRIHSDAQVFRGKYVVASFEPGPDWDGPYHGLDLGFAADPTVLTKCYVHNNKLYVECEAWQLHCDIDRLPALLDEVQDARKHTIRCDSSRPETVSYLKAHGFPNTVSVDKWPDSVQDGISRMRAFEQIVLHPRCEHTAEEFRLYAYKTDRLSGDVLPEIVDKHNHCIDSIRYAVAPLIKQGGPTAFLSFLATQSAAEAQMAKEALPDSSKPTLSEIISPWHRL